MEFHRNPRVYRNTTTTPTTTATHICAVWCHSQFDNPEGLDDLEYVFFEVALQQQELIGPCGVQQQSLLTCNHLRSFSRGWLRRTCGAAFSAKNERHMLRTETKPTGTHPGESLLTWYHGHGHDRKPWPNPKGTNHRPTQVAMCRGNAKMETHTHENRPFHNET